MASWSQHAGAVELHSFTHEYDNYSTAALLNPVSVWWFHPSIFFSMAGILGDKVSSFNTWPFYLTAGRFFVSQCTSLNLCIFSSFSGAFASMIGYYFKLMRGIPIPSVGAVSYSQIMSNFLL